MSRPTIPALAALCAMAACTTSKGEGDIPPGAETGRLRVDLASDTAAATLDPRVEEVWVRIEAVEVRHEERGWVDLSEERQDLDLMAPDGGPIGEGDVWVGAYERVSVSIVDAWIVVDGVEEDLAFTGDFEPFDPLGAGLSVDESFFVDADSETAVRIVWDLGDNLREDDGGWSLGAETRAEVDIAGGAEL